MVESGGGAMKGVDGAPVSGDTLEQAALKVLLEGDPWLKAEYGDLAATLWLEGAMHTAYDAEGPLLAVPSRPARLAVVRLVAPRDMPKLGRGGSLQSRQALVHSLVHTESWAIDLSWDIIARFGKAEAMPREFFDDFVRVAQDEGRHFRLLAARLTEIHSSYGALPAHDGLWDSAEATAHDLKARLAVEHCVHEARGLDVLPTTVSRFRRGGDEKTAMLLESVIYPEEITHCAAGVKWFSFLCRRKETAAAAADEERFLSEAPNNTTPTHEPDTGAGGRGWTSEDGARASEDGGPTSEDGHGASADGGRVPGSGGRASEGGGRASESGGRVSESEGGAAEDGRRASKDGGLVSAVVGEFHSVVRTYFRGPLKPPFNDAARAAAGFGPEWYLPLASKPASSVALR